MAQTSSTVRLIFDGSAAGVTRAAAQARAAVSGLASDQDKLSKSTRKVQSEVTALARSFGQVGVIGLGAAGIGAVGTAAAAAVPLLLGMGAAFATAKLGSDGFRKAAEQLKKPVDDLKASLSGTFAKELTPAFAKLGPLITSLQGPLTGMAKAQAAVVRGLIDVVVNAQKLGQLNAIIQGGTDLVAGMADGVNRLVAGLLAAGAAGAKSMRGLGDAVGSVLGKLGDTFSRLAADGTIAKAIDSLSATIRGLGDVAAPVVDVVVRMGAALGPSLGNALSRFGAAISLASPGLVELAGAGAALLDALAPLLPTIGEVAGALASSFAGTIRTLIPTIQALVGFINEHKDQLVALAPIVSTAATAYAEFKVLTSIAGWVNTAIAGLRLFATEAAVAGTAAEVAGAKTAVLGTKLGLIKGAAAAAALAGVALAMDQVNTSAAGGAENLQGFEENLHDIVGAGKQLASLDFVGIFADINSELVQWRQNIQSGQGAFGQFLGYIKRQLAEKLPPMTVDVDTGPGERQLSTFIRAVNGQTALVNINGNPNGAAFALREIISEINQGKGEVIIDGQPMKAQDALNYVIGLINNSNPEVLINGNPQPAGDALAGFLQRAQGSTATATLNANPALAYETVGGWTRAAEGTVGVAALDANKAPADGKVGEWVGGVSRTRGTATLDANPGQANTQLGGWKGRADTTTGTSRLDANPGLANGKVVDWKGTADRAVGTARLNADDSGARGTLSGLLRDWGSRVLTWTVRMITGAAGGGPVMNGRAGGGPVRGPGTGTSDTAGLYALSNGEHVLTAREVAAAGGHAAIFALRRRLVGGRVPRMAATRGQAAAGGSVTSSGALAMPTPQVSVAVHIGSREITDIVRTEIDTTSRATRRTVLAGAGTSF